MDARIARALNQLGEDADLLSADEERRSTPYFKTPDDQQGNTKPWTHSTIMHNTWYFSIHNSTIDLNSDSLEGENLLKWLMNKRTPFLCQLKRYWMLLCWVAPSLMLLMCQWSWDPSTLRKRSWWWCMLTMVAPVILVLTSPIILSSLSHRCAFADMTHDELNLFVMGQIMVNCFQSPSVPGDSSSPAEQKEIHNVTHQGHHVCQPTFLFLHNVGIKCFKNIKTSYLKNRPVARVHGNIDPRTISQSNKSRTWFSSFWTTQVGNVHCRHNQ